MNIWISVGNMTLFLDCLVDTGSSVTLMKGTVYDELCRRIRRSTLLKQGPKLHSVNGKPLSVRGQTEMKFDYCEPTTLVIVDDNVPDCILGIDFLRSARAKLLVSDDKVILFDKAYSTRRVPHACLAVHEDVGYECINKVLTDWSGAFSTDLHKLGRCRVEPCEIPTGTAFPIKQRPYRLPLCKRKLVEEEIDNMLQAGVIRPSRSAWASPIVLVPKKDGTTRFCVDYRRLNDVTEGDAYALPSIQEIFDSMDGASIFSTMDLTSGYWQIPVEKDSIPKTAFTTHRGNYEFVRMPFGLKNAPAIFQRTMNHTLYDLIGKCCFVYIDDIVVFSKTPQEHAEHLKLIFERLKQVDLKLKRKKCFFGLETLDLLGYTLNREGISPQESKVKPIKELAIPKNRTEVRSFLGMCNYYKQCIPNYAVYSRSLQDLTSNKVDFQWNDQRQRDFDKLKDSLSSETVMAYPQVNQPYKLYTDACEYAVGGILVQEDSEGIERPIHYLSHQLNSTQKKWATIEKEAYAIVYALQKLRPYLWGAKFEIITDHKPLKSLFLQEQKNTKIQRWAVLIAEYGAPIKYREGRNNVRADMLSRIRIQTVSVIDTLRNEESDMQINNARILLEADKILASELRDLQKEHFKEQWADAQIADSGYIIGEQGLLYSTNLPYKTAADFPRILLPPPYQKDISKRAHGEMGHLSIEKTMRRINDMYVWPGMKATVREAISKCPTCAVHKSRPVSAPMSDMPLSTYPFEIIGVDLIGPLAMSPAGNKYVLTVIDHHSGWAEAYPIPNKKCVTVETAITTKLFPQHGYPRVIIMDNGTEFNNAKWLETLAKNGVEVRRITPYHPQGNGRCERFNRTLKEMLTRLVNNQRSEWENQLPSALMAYRNSVSMVTGHTPFFLLYGRQGRLPLSATYHARQENELADRLYDHHRALDVARELTKNSRKYNRERLQKKSRESRIEVGDHVVFKAPPDRLSMTAKFDPRYLVIARRGPVVWIKNQQTGKEKTVNIDKVVLTDPEMDWDIIHPRPKRKTRPKRNVDIDEEVPIPELQAEDRRPLIRRDTSQQTESRDQTNTGTEPDMNIQLEEEEPVEMPDINSPPTPERRRSPRLLKRRLLESPSLPERKRARRELCAFVQKWFSSH